jgi:hypothetical protein
LLSSVFIFLLLLSTVSSLTQTYSKNGDAFSSATGVYATPTHCITGDTCNWLSGSQVILGVYNAGNYSGGSATWTFNVTQPLSQITSAEVKISWPQIYGKGLHSIAANTTSLVVVGSSTVASPLTSTAISCGTGDRYAFACFDAIPTYSVPISAISSNTNVTITVPSNTLWDVGTVQLVINYSEPIVCSTNAQCGVNDWIAGTNTCSNNDVYQNFKTYTCNNAGTTSSYCTNSTALTFKTDCLDTTYGAWGANYCNASGNVEKIRDVYNKGCASGACTASTTTEKQTVSTCTNGCTNGTCNTVTIVCSTNAQCGTNDWVSGTNTCTNDDVYQNFKTYTCNNPGTPQSSCSNATALQMKTDCFDTAYGSWGANYCSGSNVVKSRDVYNKGCASGACTSSTTSEVQTVQACANGCTNGTCNGGTVTTQVYDFTTNPASLTTNLAYYPVTGKVLSTTKTVYVNYNGVDYNTLIDSYALDYFAVVPLSAGTNNITVKVVDATNAVTTTTKQIIYDSTYSTAGRELIYANSNYFMLPDVAYHSGVVVIDTKRNAFIGIIPDKTIQGITPDGAKMVLNGEWYSTATNAATGLVLPNYPGTTGGLAYKILFSNNGYAYYYKYKLNLATNTAVAMGTFAGFRYNASLSSDGSTIAYYENSSVQGFVNTSTYAVTSANLNPNGGYFYDDLAISPSNNYILTTSAGSGGGTALIQYSNLSNYTMFDGWDWANEIEFSKDVSKAFIGYIGNSYYGGGGIQILDLVSPVIKGNYPLYGAGSLAVANDGRVFTAGTIAFNNTVKGNITKHGIYELVMNSAGTGFDATKVFFINLIGNVNASMNSPNASTMYDKENIYVKEGSVTCSTNSDCGTNGLTGAQFCQSNNVYMNYTTYTCNSPGTSSSTCSSTNTPQLKETCTKGCSGGICNTDTNGIKIVNGKIRIDGVEFLIKGIDYAPWLDKTGPSPFDWQEAFPQTRNEDVTSKVSNNGVISVKDYSGDGKIQAWEVIKFDVETMKKLGANTIRTYAVAQWHDQDLDGVVDNDSANLNLRELKQGDLPNWAVDELLAQANANNMKVIMGYWVQEENFAESPFVTDWTDLPIAKQAFGLAVNKYKDDPAVLAWGIGNEVNGAFNHTWFSWGVPVNDYLNALFAYTRTLDTKHPIIYAKYVSENANFDNLTADIISVNCYIYDEATMRSNGEFSIPAPSGKAYMLGEFGHIRSQSQEHWDLAQTMAGGAYLEYNNCWWKGDGQNLLGIVDEYRAINSEAYNIVYNLFGGAPACSTNAECGNVTYGPNTCSSNSVVRTVNTPTCNNSGTSNASCSIVQTTETVQVCPNTCSNGACVTACSSNTDCGINDWIYATNSCSSNDVYMNYITYTCNNPGTVSSSCTNSIVFKFKTDCGETTYGAWGANYCNANTVEKSRTVYNKGCASGECTASTTTEKQTVSTCANGCLNGACKSACSTNAQCGTATWLGNLTCSGNSILDTYRTFTCVNPGLLTSYCKTTDTIKTKSTCLSTQICSNGACVVPTCKTNTQCNDSNPLTFDKCENPNTVSSYCSHTSIACSTAANCGTNGIIGKTCSGNYLYNINQTFKCNNPGLLTSYCSSTLSNSYSTMCTYGCLNGACLPKPACSTNSSCGTNTTGVKSCDGSNVVQTSTVFTCLNPNTQSAVCDKQVSTTFVESCTNGCSAGKCLPAPCGFSDGITLSAETNSKTAWDISQVQLVVTYKVGSLTKTATLTKNGSDISSGEGYYATPSSCGGICNWLTGNQVIVGAIDSNPATWGGKVYWNFDLGAITPSTITNVTAKVYRPTSYGKGLHSPAKTGIGVLKLENMTLATLPTTYTTCGADWFSNACATTSWSYSKAINSTVCTLP